jgi:hypothetical protein
VAVTEVELPGLHPPAPRRTGTFSSRCGELTIRSGAALGSVLVAGSVGDLDAGRPLRLRGCGRRAGIVLPAGRSRLSVPAGRVFRPDHLRLSAPAPRPLTQPLDSGAVLDPGSGRDGKRDGVRLALHAPSWLVLGESYSKDWRAWCRTSSGERELGAPVPIDGFANGWRVDRDCLGARFAFAPQRVATAGIAVSGLAALVLLVLGVAALVRRRGWEPSRPVWAEAERDLAPRDPARRLGWAPALALGAAVVVVGGGLFALRAGLVLGVAAVVLLRTGLTARRLLTLAALGIVLLPLLYIVFPAGDEGGFNFDYAVDNLGAHWVAVAVVSCVAVACALDALALRRGRS